MEDPLEVQEDKQDMKTIVFWNTISNVLEEIEKGKGDYV